MSGRVILAMIAGGCLTLAGLMTLMSGDDRSILFHHDAWARGAIELFAGLGFSVDVILSLRRAKT